MGIALSESLASLPDVDKIQGSYGAFAAILEDKSVVTWGNRDYGGKSSAVEREVLDARVVEATGFAFAAIRGDGSVVTWSIN